MNKYFYLICIVFLLLLTDVTPQSVPEKKPSSQWWLNSSLADTINQYLFHIEAQYSYTKMTGAIEGEMHSGGVKIAIRKNNFTNHTEYAIDKMSMVLKSFGMDYGTESQAFTNYIDIDVTRLLYCEAGIIWERDNSIFIKNRYSFYAGAGLNGLIVEKHYLKILFAMGRVNQEYTIPVDNIDFVKGVYTALYIRQNYKYVMDQIFSLMEQAYYLNNMNDTGRYRMSIGLNVGINIIQPISLMLGYTYRFDKESDLLGAIPKNTVQTIGVNVSL